MNSKVFSLRMKILFGIGVPVLTVLGAFFLQHIANVAAVTAVANSHIQANVPQERLFDEYLNRDLQSYFCWEPNRDCRVEYEFLRYGPTQTGLSYPKYYLWVKCFKHDKLAEEGAIRIEAIEKNGFHITHFLSSRNIVASPKEVTDIFPAALADKIIDRARNQ